MKMLTVCCALSVTAVLLSLALRSGASQAEGRGPMLAHIVFFELENDSEEARNRLVTACEKYLAGHDGTVHFSVGTIAEELNREVNDRDFDVALHLVFKNKAAHDRYQEDPRHLQFIEEEKETWKTVRVFDSYLSATGGDDRQVKRIPLPDPAAHFAGMIRAQVVEKRGNKIVVLVEAVTKQWEQSKAENARALVGKKVLVDGLREDGKPAKSIARFLKALKIGDVVPLDVAHQKGEALTLLELTEEQRRRVDAD